MASTALSRATDIVKRDKYIARDAEFPRATIILFNGVYLILRFTSAQIYEFVATTNHELAHFDNLTAAITHAQREIHALRARRHPAGQSWLRDERP